MKWNERVAGLGGDHGDIFQQQYGGRQKIAGSVVHTLKRAFPDPEHGGSIRELARLDNCLHLELAEVGFELTVRQINVTIVQPGVAVGLHVHPDQREAWFVVPYGGSLTAYLIDLRDDSPTRGGLNMISLGYRDTIIGIPEGVLHGYWNPTSRPAVLIYLTSHHFSADTESSMFQEGRFHPAGLPEDLKSKLPPHMEP